MSPETCSRVRDAASLGRLWGDAALMEHASACEVCASELRALKKRRDFRDAFPVLTSIADQSDRASGRAQPRADQEGPRKSRRLVYLMMAAVVAIIGFFAQSGAFRTRSTAADGDRIVASGAPTFRIFNIADAVFESKAEGGTVRSSLTRGVAAFHVERLAPEQRFLVALPDGDIEVRGTRFVVTVEGAKTQGVEVNEGTIELRLQGRAPTLLSAGQRWPSAAPERPTISFMRMPPRQDAAAPEPSPPSD
jgi:ferric-dicitrate binding protein FerR (iron transport regulator)